MMGVRGDISKSAASGGILQERIAMKGLAPLDLLHRAHGIAQKHLMSVAPWAARAALVNAVALHNLGILAYDRGDQTRARELLEGALSSLNEARAVAPPTPRDPDAPARIPRFAYTEQIQRNLVHSGVSLQLETPSWWRHGGLAAQFDALGHSDAALAHRLCASALLGDSKSGAGEFDEPGACTDVARCELWLDVANGYESRGDEESAKVYRDRAYRHARDAGFSASSSIRKRCWAEQRRLHHKAFETRA
eukprot:TRINITY_DN23518_c0_g1_i1.p1 TRINITY_DN23518_c0_g1~~TRINITY_DN23518_c0_g1_i1.p1  ORF type:complete len:285 (-),score=52.94 TRINITY_DN23518_c0_g1_i1:203-952(-)